MSADTTTSPTRETRGAGSGENAVAHRSRTGDDDPAQANDIHKLIKKRQADAVKTNQKFADETEKDDDDENDAPEPLPVTEYPEGDPDKGALDFDNLDNRNEAANDQLNALQVLQNRRVQRGTNALSDPDYLREVSMVTAQAALKAHDPDVVKKNHDEMAKRLKMRQEREAKAAAK
jgi:hypothetical protein